MNYLEIAGTAVGLVYLWLEFKASFYLWIAGIVMPLIYIFVYYDAGLYADCGINVYYVLASLYGMAYWRWRKNKQTGQTEELPVTHTPQHLYLPILAVLALLTVAIAQILIHFTNSNVPWTDSFTTALSIVAMWMLSRKFAEQWLAWVLVDAVSGALYIYKGLYFTAGLYILYTLIAYFGYLKWKKMIVTPTAG